MPQQNAMELFVRYCNLVADPDYPRSIADRVFDEMRVVFARTIFPYEVVKTWRAWLAATKENVDIRALGCDVETEKLLERKTQEASRAWIESVTPFVVRHLKRPLNDDYPEYLHIHKIWSAHPPQ